MHNHSHHNHGHHHHHAHGKSLFWAIVFNVILTLVQLVAGVFSGSLSLMADALHNFSDAGALIIAYFANKISGLPANNEMTFGYGRAQILGALINSVTLVIVGLYLIYEAVIRFSSPQPVQAWIIILVAGGALIIDLVTAALTYAGSKENVNMRAVFIHNLSDAMASVVVIISGIMILLFKAYWVDLVATIFIAIYVLYHSVDLIKETVTVLMQGVPSDINKKDVINAIESLPDVKGVHHVHIWSVHDKLRSLESHITVDKKLSLVEIESIKQKVKELLKKSFHIDHSTLEFEISSEVNCYSNEKGEPC